MNESRIRFPDAWDVKSPEDNKKDRWESLMTTLDSDLLVLNGQISNAPSLDELRKKDLEDMRKACLELQRLISRNFNIFRN